MNEPKKKKPISLPMVMMTFITISVIFSVLAFGYGKASMAIEYNEWIDENIDAVCDVVSGETQGDQIVWFDYSISEIINNTDTTLSNTTNTTLNSTGEEL